MEKQSLIHNKVVYLAIPKRLYDCDIVKRAEQYLRTLKPLVLVDPRGMFENNEQWLNEFPKYLKNVEAVVVITDNGYVGKGVYKEVAYCDGKKKPCYRYIENDQHQSIVEITGLHIVNWNNWTDYAKVNYD